MVLFAATHGHWLWPTVAALVAALTMVSLDTLRTHHRMDDAHPR